MLWGLWETEFSVRLHPPRIFSNSTRGSKILFSMCDMFGKIGSFMFLTGALFRSSTSSLCSLCYDKPRGFRFRSESWKTSRLPIQFVGKLFNLSKLKFTTLFFCLQFTRGRLLKKLLSKWESSGWLL